VAWISSSKERNVQVTSTPCVTDQLLVEATTREESRDPACMAAGFREDLDEKVVTEE